MTRQMATLIFKGLGTEGWNPNWQCSCCQLVFQWVGVPGGILLPTNSNMRWTHQKILTRVRLKSEVDKQGLPLAVLPQVPPFGYKEHNWKLKSPWKMSSPSPASADNTGRWLRIARPPISPGVKNLKFCVTMLQNVIIVLKFDHMG